jgi:hypothetical protein|tara:strand:+ start:2148 stop:3251 length:1104 start_codon:yes stop_codon:yes gene_type:complete
MSTDMQKITDSLSSLATAIQELANDSPTEIEINDRSLSGNKIHGGMITKFQSKGIKDESTKDKVLVNDLGLHVDNISVESILNPLTIKGDLNVEGNITATKLHVNEITADIRHERTSPLEFVSEGDAGIYGKGLQWRGDGPTKQFVYRGNPDRIWTTESIDLNSGCSLYIDSVPVLSEKELGSTISKSSLTTVGTLNNLQTSNDLCIDGWIYYESDSNRLGIGTEAPNAQLSIVSLESEFIVDCETSSTRIGNWTTDNLDIVTDNTTRITINAHGDIVLGTNNETKTKVVGKLGINVNNPSNDIETSGPVKFQGKKFETGIAVPTSGLYNIGDIVWNQSPTPTGYVGWICVREGSPGEWKPFGQINV